MEAKHNWDEVVERYKYYYEEAKLMGHRKLPYYEIQPWDKVLDQICLRIFQDIKSIGIRLYPIFPISADQYFHFANPYNRTAIQVIYKNSKVSIINRKLEIFKPQGWTVYKTQSTKAIHTFEEFCNFKSVEFDDLNEEEQFDFYDINKEENDYCLLQYIKAMHFTEELAFI